MVDLKVRCFEVRNEKWDIDVLISRIQETILQYQKLPFPTSRILIMTATAHALVGGAIAASIADPAIGLSLAFISHPILDMIPHWDLGLGWRKKNKYTLFLESSLDLVFGVALAFLIFGRGVEPVYFLACIFASEIWDIMMMPYLLLNWKFFPFKTVYNFQHKIQSNVKLPWGILTQAATVYAAVLLLKFAHVAS